MSVANARKQATSAGFPVALIIVLIVKGIVSGAPLRNIPQEILQPDGTLLHCFASGDEFHNWLHDADGFTIIQDQETGFYVYADERNGQLIPTPMIAGRDNPAEGGLLPHANIPPEEMMRKREEFNRLMFEAQKRVFNGNAQSAYQQSSFDKLNNIVIFIRFNDETEFVKEYSFYDQLHNKQGSGVHSLYEYFKEASYGKFEIFSTLYPVPSGNEVISYQDAHPRAYYQKKSVTNLSGYDGDQERTQRLHTLLKNAVEFVEQQIPQHINLDKNNDGKVDGVSFIVRGRPEGWSDLLWPHRWILFSHEVTMHGKRVWDYTFLLEEGEVTNTIPLGTIAHEMFHVLGAPDLYRYDESGFIPVGPWDLMSTTDFIPPHMNAYMKFLYGGWVSEIPVITKSGTYHLHPLHNYDESNQNKSFYKIPSAGSPYEFFVVEYRSHSSIFDSTLPGEGLIIYRVNILSEGKGNFYTPDEVYVYRPNGNLTENGAILQAHYSANTGRTTLSDHTSPLAFLSDGSPSGVHISHISDVGETMSFDVTIDYEPPGALVHYDGGDVFIDVGMNQEVTYEVAIRLTGEELSGLYGKDMTSIVVFINDGGGNDVTLKVWEGGSVSDPGTLVHSEFIGDDIKPGEWYAHDLNKAVKLQQGLEYWVGYRINATGGWPLIFDGGPGVTNKSAWIHQDDGWKSFHDFGFDLNLRIRAVVTSLGSAILSVADDPLNMAVYPDRTKNTSLRISNTGTGPLTFTVAASGGESVISKAVPSPFRSFSDEVKRPELHRGNQMSGSETTKSMDRMSLRNHYSTPDLNTSSTSGAIPDLSPSSTSGAIPDLSPSPASDATPGLSPASTSNATTGSHPGSASNSIAGFTPEPAAATSDEVVLILDDGNHMPDGFLGGGGGNYFYWRNDFQLEKDFDLEKIRFYMKTETESTNLMEILVFGTDGSLVFNTTHTFDVSASGRWYEFSFPDHARNNMKFKKGGTFTLITGSLNLNIKFPAGYDAEGRKPGFSYYGYYAYLFNEWIFSGWANLNVFFEKGAWLIRAVGKDGSVVQNQPPVAVAQVTPKPAGVHQPVTFNGANSYDPDGQITAYLWEFGDGQTSTQMNTTHTYTQPGDYTYRLTVTDNLGATGQTADIICITATPSRWTVDPSTGSIAAGSYRDVTISFNSEGLTEGLYQGEVAVSSNAGNISIPVAITISKEVSVDEHPHAAWNFRLDQNYPNPFNPSTTIRWEMGSEDHVLLTLYDITGRQVARILNEHREAGMHEILFDAAHLSSGVYLYRIRIGDFTDIRPMMLMK